MKSVSVPDDAAGKETPCPECGEPFSVPARYTPVVATAPPPAPPIETPAPQSPVPVHPEASPMSSALPDRPPPPPGLVPPAYPSPNAQLASLQSLEPPLPPVPPGYTHSRSVVIRPRVLEWVPVVCLTLILILTFCNWVGSYVEGSPVYAQNAWRALTGYPSRNYKLEELLTKQAAWPADVLNNVSSDWLLMLPFLLVLILATVLAWAERTVTSLDKKRLPPPLQWVATIWPYRAPVIAGLATIAFFLIAIQMLNGFGLERAMKRVVAERYAAERKNAEGDPAALDAINYKQDQELARFNLERTTWLYLAVVLLILVILVMIAHAGLERRGNKPLPRIVIQY